MFTGHCVILYTDRISYFKAATSAVSASSSKNCLLSSLALLLTALFRSAYSIHILLCWLSDLVWFILALSFLRLVMKSKEHRLIQSLWLLLVDLPSRPVDPQGLGTYSWSPQNILSLFHHLPPWVCCIFSAQPGSMGHSYVALISKRPSQDDSRFHRQAPS